MAVVNDNGDRTMRILARLDLIHRARLAKEMLRGAQAALMALPPKQGGEILEESWFDLKPAASAERDVRIAGGTNAD